MRLTRVLLRNNFRRAYNDIWKNGGRRPIRDPQYVVELVEGEGLQVEDALKVAGTYAPIYTKSEVVKRVPYNEEDDPDWHDRLCHFFSLDSCLLEGLAHAQSLTKTCKVDGLAPKIEAAVENLQLNDRITESIDKGIMQAYIWDAHQDKLPRKFDETRPCHVFRREYGIPLHKKIDILLHELIRLGQVHYPNKDTSKSRVIQNDLHASAPIEKDGDLLQFTVSSDLALTCRSPLTPIDDGKTSVDTPHPDIYPLKSILDLKPKNLYKLIDYSSFSRAPSHRFVHTLFLTKTDGMSSWSHSQLLGRAVGTCFGVALAQLRSIHGMDVSEVPRPVVVQCVQTDGKLFDFITYQLNTINLDGTEGIKNMVWIDEKRQLVAQCDQIKGKPVFGGVDYDVAKRFFAFCTNDSMQ